MTPTMQWQDIRYAPKNGDKVDLWMTSQNEPKGHRLPNCFWSQEHETFMVFCPRRGADVRAELHMDSRPTHFMIVEGPK